MVSNKYLVIVKDNDIDISNRIAEVLELELNTHISVDLQGVEDD